MFGGPPVWHHALSDEGRAARPRRRARLRRRGGRCWIGGSPRPDRDRVRRGAAFGVGGHVAGSRKRPLRRVGRDLLRRRHQGGAGALHASRVANGCHQVETGAIASSHSSLSAQLVWNALRCRRCAEGARRLEREREPAAIVAEVPPAPAFAAFTGPAENLEGRGTTERAASIGPAERLHGRDTTERRLEPSPGPESQVALAPDRARGNAFDLDLDGINYIERKGSRDTLPARLAQPDSTRTSARFQSVRRRAVV